MTNELLITRLRADVQRLTQERDRAREYAEEGCRYMVEFCHEDAEEFCPPWIDLTLWLTQLGQLSESDHDEMVVALEEGQ
jgi:hypothetical protein